jgi:hypothetical protein
VWRADLTRSARPAENLYRSATLQATVTGDTVAILDIVEDESGRRERTTNTLIADGRERLQQYGYATTAAWLSPRCLQATVNRDGRVEGQVTYEVAPGGETLTLVTDSQKAVFVRVPAGHIPGSSADGP